MSAGDELDLKVLEAALTWASSAMEAYPNHYAEEASCAFNRELVKVRAMLRSRPGAPPPPDKRAPRHTIPVAELGAGALQDRAHRESGAVRAAKSVRASGPAGNASGPRTRARASRAPASDPPT